MREGGNSEPTSYTIDEAVTAINEADNAETIKNVLSKLDTPITDKIKLDPISDYIFYSKVNDVDFTQQQLLDLVNQVLEVPFAATVDGVTATLTFEYDVESPIEVSGKIADTALESAVSTDDKTVVFLTAGSEIKETITVVVDKGQDGTTKTYEIKTIDNQLIVIKIDEVHPEA